MKIRRVVVLPEVGIIMVKCRAKSNSIKNNLKKYSINELTISSFRKVYKDVSLF